MGQGHVRKREDALNNSQPAEHQCKQETGQTATLQMWDQGLRLPGMDTTREKEWKK